MENQPQLVVCYSLGTGAGFDTQLAGFSRQICEDLAECLALNASFIAVPQMILVREAESLRYDVAHSAGAFAVFYSLPETRWIIEATRSLGGDIALTGRLLDDDSGMFLSINMMDVRRGLLLFCSCESMTRETLHESLARLASRALAHFSDRPAESWLDDVWQMIGTHTFSAYSNWMALREAERRAQREGLPAPTSRLIEHACYALGADAHFGRASEKLCELLSGEVKTASCEFVVRSLANIAHLSPTNALAYAQCLGRVGRREDASSFLSLAVSRFPEEPLFVLMRGCLASDEKTAKADLANARNRLGDKYEALKKMADAALLNVQGV